MFSVFIVRVLYDICNMMDDESQDDKPIGTVLSRHRSPIFSKEEIKALLSLINEHKTVLLNKSVSNVACHAKEVTWNNIAKVFNSHGFKHSRNVDSLKMKWDNLKRDARKVSKNLIDIKHNDFDDITSQTVTMICEAENNANDISLTKERDLETEELKQLKDESVECWNENCDKSFNEDTERTCFKKRIVNRSWNFSPQECSLLLKCVRAEKKYVFSKTNNTKAVDLKNRAWSRIANSFNKQCPQKRSTKSLRTKFNNMKKLTNKSNTHLFPNKCAKLGTEEKEKIKIEPVFNVNDELDCDGEDGSDHDDMPSSSGQNGDLSFGDNCHTQVNSENIASDPLSTILDGDSGLGLMNVEEFTHSDSRRIERLKVELLNYQLENAKMERKRIEEATQAEAKLKEARATETALRLRAARLACVAAHARLPPAHPALHFASGEEGAQYYLDQFHT